jgi:Ca2+/Na+ antiporter
MSIFDGKLTTGGKFLALGVSASFYYYFSIVVIAEVFLLGIVLGALLHNYLIGLGVSFAGFVLIWFHAIRLFMHWILFAFLLILAFHLLSAVATPLAIFIVMFLILFLLAVNYEFFIRMPQRIAQNARGTLIEDPKSEDDS